MFALQDSPAQERNAQGWRIMVDRGPLGNRTSGEHLGPYISHMPTRELTSVKATRKIGLTPGSLREFNVGN